MNNCILRIAAAHMLLLPVVSFMGCGNSGPEKGPTVPVTGKVTLDGEPFSEAAIWFLSPSQGFGFHSELQSDGSYQLTIEDTQIGDEYQVLFGGKKAPEGAVDGAGAPLDTIPPPLPSHYLDGNTSGLTAKIDKTDGLNFDFELTSE